MVDRGVTIAIIFLAFMVLILGAIVGYLVDRVRALEDRKAGRGTGEERQG